MQIRYIIIISVILFLYSCIEEYEPELKDYNSEIVIEGTITNEPGPYEIKITKSSAVDNPRYSNVRDAEVIIMDDNGNIEYLYETSPGRYITAENGIQGTVGHKYKLIVNADGKSYESNYEELISPCEIDSVYAQIENKGRYEGLQFYVNTHNKSENNYFLWRITETFKYKSDDYPLEYIYVLENDFEIIIPVTDPDAIRTCWKTDNIFEIITASTQNLTREETDNFKLHYVDNESKRLLIKYSILVNQYTISEHAYNFWTEMKEQNDESGTLYSRQPYHLKTNIYNTENSEETVLGYFMVASVVKKRIFVDRPPINFNIDYCKASPFEFNRWLERKNRTYPIYVRTVEGELGKAGLGCFDCRIEGGSYSKPDFWED